ncbi:MmcQ/YjbR family DNA-binding protein [Pseudonocardia sp. MH-G8]|uniref:MmcQ/YjbR family DNA-binding protein n=1 Tax=Pseudonocardia sp. MH-G8 TaxID=1854588 RepID=UPI0018E9E565|nr:MmcQ/YjbR family DNA-binding protein [Pseudonocardia sp. MH-G8]
MEMLTGERLQSIARETARSLPGVSHGRPFVEKLDVYKVGAKVFLIVTDDPDEQIITVKADPGRGHLLRDQYASVTAGRYLDKRHWVSVGAGEGVTEELVTELVRDSFDLVGAGR